MQQLAAPPSCYWWQWRQVLGRCGCDQLLVTTQLASCVGGLRWLTLASAETTAALPRACFLFNIEFVHMHGCLCASLLL
jgi:hypothetical protein